MSKVCVTVFSMPSRVATLGRVYAVGFSFAWWRTMASSKKTNVIIYYLVEYNIYE